MAIPILKNISGPSILDFWERCLKLPGGSWIFSRALGFLIPYTGSIGAQVKQLNRGSVIVTLEDRRAVRNHLQSIHAIALANLGEVTSGLAVMSCVPENGRAILKSFQIEYLKKARGTLRAQSELGSSQFLGEGDHEVEVQIFNEANVMVAQASALWLVGTATKGPQST